MAWSQGMAWWPSPPPSIRSGQSLRTSAMQLCYSASLPDATPMIPPPSTMGIRITPPGWRMALGAFALDFPNSTWARGFQKRLWRGSVSGRRPLRNWGQRSSRFRFHTLSMLSPPIILPRLRRRAPTSPVTTASATQSGPMMRRWRRCIPRAVTAASARR